MDGAYAALVAATPRAIAVNHAERQCVTAVLSASLENATVNAAQLVGKIFKRATKALNARKE